MVFTLSQVKLMVDCSRLSTGSVSKDGALDRTCRMGTSNKMDLDCRSQAGTPNCGVELSRYIIFTALFTQTTKPETNEVGV